jgi:hypothetical protein
VLERTQDFQRRREAAMAKLRANLGAPLTGVLHDRIAAFLETDAPGDVQLELLDEIEELDGSLRAKRVLAAYVLRYVKPQQDPTKQDDLVAQSPEAQDRSRPCPTTVVWLTVSVNLDGYSLFIDGAAKGSTGIQAHEVAAGEH